jgi:Tfp pilus assembly protein PilX
MKTFVRNERGFALVVALAFIAVLAVIASVSVWVAGSEKKVTFNEQVHQMSFYAADAGGEAAINWLRIQSSPPGIIDAQNTVRHQDTYAPLSSKQEYKFDVRFLRKRNRPGWSVEYKDFDYLVISDGASVRQSQSQVELSVARLFKEGY